MIERLSLVNTAVALLREQHLLVEAAAGYGKSVLLRQLLPYLPGAVYLPLTVDDNDVAVLRRRVREAGAQTLLVDDAHLLARGSEAAAWLQARLEAAGPRLVVAGRYLPFPAAPLLAQEAAARWDEAELAFSAEVMARLLPAEQAGAWQERLAGWPLGVGLLRHLPAAQRKPETVESDPFAYLARAVFERLEAPLQEFLRVTAVPLEFSGDLAAHLLEIPASEVAARIETIGRRNLFLSAGSRPDAHRYHDLFRDFLLAQGDREARRRLAQKTVSYYAGRDEGYPLAVEQALEAGLHERATALLLDVHWEYLHASYRYRTFDRWVMSLDPAVRDAHPALYWMAGHCLVYLPDREREAFTYFERSEALALEAEDPASVFAARYEQAHLRYMLDGATPELAAALAQIAGEAPPGQKSGLRALRTLSALQAELGRFTQAKATWHAAYRQAKALGLSEMLLQMMKRQYALYMLTPLGEYAEAHHLFADAIAYTADSPGNQLEVLTNYCDLLVPMGAWEELEATLARIDGLAAEMEDLAGYIRLWLHFYRGMLAVARQRPEAAGRAFNAMRRHGEEGLEVICERLGRIWLARRTGNLEAIGGWLAEVTAQQAGSPYHAAWAFLEADIARGLAAVTAGERYSVSPAALTLYRFRARGDLLRLRALLAVLCHGQGQPRWRRLARIVLRELERPHYPALLTRRDPELGAYFWRTLLVEGMAGEQAAEALVAAGVVEPLLPLLAHEAAAVRRQGAHILARIGDEQAMGALGKAIRSEKQKETKQALVAARNALEQAHPPPLQITLMGGFVVRRGETPIEDFHRPIVARLLQYFAVHRGRALARDRILEDLWPDRDPEKAWRTYRTVYSRLRNALEPHVRSKGPNRYFSLDGDSYTFDPEGHVTVDVEQFRQQLQAELPPERLAPLLEGYRPVLPELPYADWLLELRAQIQEMYVDGCLRLGQQLLARGEAAAAQQWAQRAVTAAPWLEAAYQLLMRAYARQNRRSRALRTYEEAREALAAELAVEPSPLTEWLYTRLQAGETI